MSWEQRGDDGSDREAPPQHTCLGCSKVTRPHAEHLPERVHCVVHMARRVPLRTSAHHLEGGHASESNPGVERRRFLGFLLVCKNEGLRCVIPS